MPSFTHVDVVLARPVTLQLIVWKQSGIIYSGGVAVVVTHAHMKWKGRQ